MYWVHPGSPDARGSLFVVVWAQRIDDRGRRSAHAFEVVEAKAYSLRLRCERREIDVGDPTSCLGDPHRRRERGGHDEGVVGAGILHLVADPGPLAAYPVES